MSRIHNFSRSIRVISQWLFYVVLVGTITSVILLFAGPKLGSAAEVMNIHVLEHSMPVSALTLDISLALAMTVALTFGIFFFGIHHFIKLFKLYEKGKIFTAENVFRLKMLGLALIIYFPVSLITRGLKLYVLLRLDKEFSIRLDHFFINFDIFIIGLAVVLISWVMDEARKMNDEMEMVI